MSPSRATFGSRVPSASQGTKDRVTGWGREDRQPPRCWPAAVQAPAPTRGLEWGAGVMPHPIAMEEEAGAALVGAQDGCCAGRADMCPVHTHKPAWSQAAPRMPELLFLPSQQCLKTSPGRVSLTYLPSPQPPHFLPLSLTFLGLDSLTRSLPLLQTKPRSWGCDSWLPRTRLVPRALR